MSDLRFVPPLHPNSQLDAARRQQDLERAATEDFDLVVIGGGITGTGIALDAVTRGLSVVLLEAKDLAFGTSRWSSKLVHGGLRYLAKGDVGLAWESARERAVVASRIAPHLVTAIPQVVPDFAGSRRSAALAMAGFLAGDSLRVAARTPRGVLPRARRVDRETALQLVPGMRQRDLLGASVGWEIQLVDDARLVIAVARTAAAHGAAILTQTNAMDVDPAHGSVTVNDERTGDSFTVQARHIINAAGVWSDRLDPDLELSPSLGSHVVIPTELVGAGHGSLTVQVPGEINRFVFALPQSDGLTYVGITDHPAPDGVVDEPSAPDSDINWILEVLNQALERPVDPSQRVGSFAGLRPLVSSAVSDSSADISRQHLIRRTDRLISIVGGKLTTYRRMAEDAVDQVTSRPCVTKQVALVGSGPSETRLDVPADLWRYYGNEAPGVWDNRGSADSTVDPAVAARLRFGLDFEGAATPADLLDRRTRASFRPVSKDLQAYASQLVSTMS